MKRNSASPSLGVFTVGVCMPYGGGHWLDSINGTRRMSGEFVRAVRVEPSGEWQGIDAALVSDDGLQTMSTAVYRCKELVVVRTSLGSNPTAMEALARQVRWHGARAGGQEIKLSIVRGLMDALAALEIDPKAPSAHLVRITKLVLMTLVIAVIVTALVLLAR